MPRRTVPHPTGLALAQRIATLRAEQGLTLGGLAVASGISRGHLSNIERGLAVITVATLETIARGLGVEVFYLLVFPEKSMRDQCVERLRALKENELRSLFARLRQSGGLRRPRAARPRA